MKKIFMISFTLAILFGCTTAIKPYSNLKLPKNNIIFTFDDGPNEHSEVTLKVLEVLKKYNIKAYFCVIGKNVQKNPEIIKKIYKNGNIIVNHSFSHSMPLFLSKKEILREIDLNDAEIGKALNISNYKSLYYRPPYAIISQSVEEGRKERNIKIAGLSVFSISVVDSEYHPANYKKVVQFYKESIEKDQGGIIVLHDGFFRGGTIKVEDCIKIDKEVNRTWVPIALEEIIKYFAEKNYTFNLYDEIY